VALAAEAPAAGVVAEAMRALGSEQLKTITYSGSAFNIGFGQTRSATGPWPTVTVAGYTRAIDFPGGASRASGATMVSPNTGGPRRPAIYTLAVTPQTPAWTLQSELCITPWGFLMGAATRPTTLRTQRIGGKPYSVVSWTTEQKAPSGLPYTVTGYINEQHLVDRVETWVDHPILGDMHVDTRYSDYRDFGGVKVPTRIVQQRGGEQTFEARITGATPNPSNIAALLQPPPPPPGAPPAAAPPAGGAPPPVVKSDKLGNGVYRITGGYVALAIEFDDHVMVLEGGQSEARGLAIIAETHRLFPNKPIRYVFNTHPHFDHASGLAPFVAEGSTIITQQNNVAALGKALSSPRKLVGDTLAKSGKKPRFAAVGTKRVFKDGTGDVEFHHVQELGHSDGMLVAFLPAQKILFQADFALPQPGQPANPSVVTLVENLDRLKLGFDSYVGVHAPTPDRIQTRAELMAAVGR
jgi:glyoxylase-like metal-dependent hydrolase (beta-lactamase superfamily II)